MKCHSNSENKSLSIAITSASAPTQSYKDDDLINVEMEVGFKIKREVFNKFKNYLLNDSLSQKDFFAMIEQRG